jgi:predicted nucleotidyltransferase
MNPYIHTKSELLNILIAHKDNIKSFGVKEMGLFGSFAVDKNIGNESDVDFLIEFYPEKKNYDNFVIFTIFYDEILLNVSLNPPCLIYSTVACYVFLNFGTTKISEKQCLKNDSDHLFKVYF